MAGSLFGDTSDNLFDPYKSDLAGGLAAAQADPFALTRPQESDELSFDRLLRLAERRREQEAQAQKSLADFDEFLEFSGASKKKQPLTGMAGLRAAEDAMAKEATLDVEAASKHLEQFEIDLSAAETNLAAERDKFIEHVRTNVDLTDSKQRAWLKSAMDQFKTSQREIVKARRQLEDGRAAVKRMEAEEALRGTDVSAEAAMAGLAVDEDEGGGVLSMLMEPIAAMQESFSGIGSLATEGLDKALAGMGLGDRVTEDGGRAGEAWGEIALMAVPLVGPLYQTLNEDSALRTRGRGQNEAAGYQLDRGIGDVLESRGYDRELEYADGKTIDYGVPNVSSLFRNMLEAAGLMDDATSDEYSQITMQLQYEIATDPLNVVDFGAGKVSKLGKLRDVAKINRKSAQTLAKVRTLNAMPEVKAALGRAALTSTDEGVMVALRGAKGENGARLFTNEEAVNLAADFDALFASQMEDVHKLAATDAVAFVDEAKAALDGAEALGMGAKAAKAQRGALDDYMKLSGKVGESALYRAFVKNADEINPILGSTIQEQARLNQRLAPMEHVGKGIDWVRKSKGSRWISKVVGNGMKADIPVDDLEWYYKQKLAASAQSADVMRSSYEATEQLAQKLNGLPVESRGRVLEAMPMFVEGVGKGQRAAVRRAEETLAEAHEALYQAKRAGRDTGRHEYAIRAAEEALESERGRLSDAASRMVEVRKTLSDDEMRIAQEVAGIYADQQDFMLHVQKRYGREMHELVDDFDYYQRQFSPEVRKFLADNPTAKRMWDEWKSGEIAKATREGFERERKMKGVDFYEAEAKLREILNIPKDVPVWERDVVEVLQGRMFGAASKAEKAIWTSAFAERFGVLDEVAFQRARATSDARTMNRVRAALDAVFRRRGEAFAADDLLEAWMQGRDALRKAISKQRTAAKGATKDAGVADDIVGVLDVLLEGRDASWEDIHRMAQMRLDIEDARRAVSGAEITAENAAHTEYIKALEAIVDTGGKPASVDEAMKLHRKARAALARVRAADAAAVHAGDVLYANVPDSGMIGGLAPEGTGSALRGVDESFSDLQRASAMRRKKGLEAVSGAEAREAREAAAELFESRKAINAALDDLYRTVESAKGTGLTKVVEKAIKAAEKRVLTAAGSTSAQKWKGVVGGILADLRKTSPEQWSNVLERHRKRAAAVMDELERAAATGDAAVGRRLRSDAARKAKAADKAAEYYEAVERASKLETWDKADVAAHYRKIIDAQKDGRMSALKMMQDLGVALPDDPAEIARLAATFIDEADMKTITTMADGLWDIGKGKTALDQIHKAGRWYDKLKQVYQRAVLARFPSLAKDMLGTASNAVMSGAVTELDEALKLVGGLKKWQRGSKYADSRLARLQAEGVLQTTKGEALDNIGAIERAAAASADEGGRIARTLRNIGESGVIGGTLRSLGLGKAGKKVGSALGQLNEARVWWEEVMRVAEYLRATKKGLNHADAVTEVYKWWGNFSELSKVERAVLNRMLFFFSWQKRAIPIAVRHLFYHPVRSRMMLALMAGDAQGNEEMPEWIRRTGGHILGTDDNGNWNAIGTGGGSYFSPANDLAQSGASQKAAAGNVSGAISDAGAWFMRSAPPFVSGAFEKAMEQDYFTAKPWYNPHTGQSQVKAPAVLSWLGEDSPIGRFLEMKKHVDPDDPNRITHFTMDPEVANALGFIPGFEPTIQDVSSFADPRASDAGPLSLRKGASRAVGLPIYTFQKFDDADKLKFKYRKFFDAMKEEVSRNPHLGLRYANESVVIDDKSEKGQEMAYDLKRWTDEYGAEDAERRFSNKYERQSTLIDLAAKVRQVQAAKLREMEGVDIARGFKRRHELEMEQPTVPALSDLLTLGTE